MRWRMLGKKAQSALEESIDYIVKGAVVAGVAIIIVIVTNLFMGAATNISQFEADIFASRLVYSKALLPDKGIHYPGVITEDSFNKANPEKSIDYKNPRFGAVISLRKDKDSEAIMKLYSEDKESPGKCQWQVLAESGLSEGAGGAHMIPDTRLVTTPEGEPMSLRINLYMPNS
ncbi:hypothetical protein COT48_03135 [Candidatus Woesearchaeota archaeon CG08_land_8_20_14_0_20_47_9]|nr:MAG: hypothetical protein AUJ69_03125 [Candidatus Woesearchaeota archaeon CG1_02_47_18]PIN74960.1 MAG: hypothetical protein COV22_00990 [Candidatus Woesearchaeota archaeon CG10_big_fil_rev_8_21_14_0_10_47_5]PIO03921.1 MAG: hypothetical protein COT48_03135 [Candidatus Woesearchaeota archaeon CG08_land_8_20_14_0_20_47_9]